MATCTKLQNVLIPHCPWTKDGKKIWRYIVKLIHIYFQHIRYDKNSRKGKMLWIQRNLRLTDASRIHLVRRAEKKSMQMVVY